MREIEYRDFSLRTHKKNWRMKRPNVCQFELTFGCGLHCVHCYTDCYNRPGYTKRELATDEVKIILDKVYQAGVNWICFTGGDPLTREDFLDIYSYTKAKGFIVTIFTNSYSMNRELAGHLRKKPPFLIEMTLNAVTKYLYEKMSQVEGSFEKVIAGINLILKAELPIKIKTQITKDNLGEIPRLREFIEGLGLRFRPSYDLHARLNGDSMPCNLRILPNEILGPNGDKCARTKNRIPNASLFRCAIGGGDGIQIDPYGNIFACNLIRKPYLNLLRVDIDHATDKLLSLVRNRKFVTDSRCNGCSLREKCNWCPGRAYLEKGDMEAPIQYYCELARMSRSASAK